jgi:hypothetical protein
LREQLPVPVSFNASLFERADFKSLRGTPGVPVEPISQLPANPKIFDVK